MGKSTKEKINKTDVQKALLKLLKKAGDIALQAIIENIIELFFK